MMTYTLSPEVKIMNEIPNIIQIGDMSDKHYGERKNQSQ